MNVQWTALNLFTVVWTLAALPVVAVGLMGWDPVGRWGGRGLGRHLNSRWSWFAMEVPGLVAFPAIYLTSGNLHVVGNIVLVLWLAHYVHRTCVWPFLVQKRTATVPLAMSGAAVSFNLVNSTLVGWFMAYAADYAADWLTDPRFVLGLVLMLGGAALNVWADYRLLALRKANEGRHVMPGGGAFDRIACPNLSGEIVEWIGFALLTWCLPGLAFALWTIANLVPRAVWRRNWYRETFSDYPKDRPALFPGLL